MKPFVVLLCLSGLAAADASVGATASRRCMAVHAHGEGRTRYNPYEDKDHFLREDEAKQAIEEELAAAGIHFTVRDQQFSSLKEQHEMHLYRELGKPHDTVYVAKPIVLDGYDPATKTGFVFLGNARYLRMRRLFAGVPGDEDWYRYELKLFAGKAAAAAAADKGLRHLGIFYDPLSADSLADLRAQVRDFVTCLKR